MTDRALIPGDPAELAALAAAWRSAAEQVDVVHADVAANGLNGSWSGAAGDAFRVALEGLHGELAPIAPSIYDGGSAIAAFARELEELQARAARQERAVEEAEHGERDAGLRQTEARLKLDAARAAQAASADPVGLATARAAVRACEDLLAVAAAGVAEAEQRLAELGAGLRALEAEYEQAVGRCATALGSARHAAANRLASWIDRTLPTIAAGALARAGIGWGELLHAADPYLEAEGVFSGMVGVADFVAEHKPLSSIDRFDVYAVRLGRSPAMGALGWMGFGLDLYGSTSSALQDTRGLTPQGRALATSEMDGVSVLLSDPQLSDTPLGVVQAANMLSGNSLEADLGAFALMEAGAVSGFQRDGLGGAVQGTSQELDIWSEGAAAGQFGPVVEGIAHVEDAVIEHPGQVAADVSHGVDAAVRAGDAVASDAGHAVARATGDVEHAAGHVEHIVEHAAGHVEHGVEHAAGDVASLIGL